MKSLTPTHLQVPFNCNTQTSQTPTPSSGCFPQHAVPRCGDQQLAMRSPRRKPTLISPAFHRAEPRGRERDRREARMGERAGANESNALQITPKLYVAIYLA